MDDRGSGTISTDSASLTVGSDAVIHFGDILPQVTMDAPPDVLAHEMDLLSTNPYVHFV